MTRQKDAGPYYVVVEGFRGLRKPCLTQAEAEARALEMFQYHEGKRVVRVVATIGEILPRGNRG